MSIKKIGIMFGMENTFPPALVEKINGMKVEGVTAEFVKLGGVKMAEPSGYRVIIDRISQDIPFYRAYLKNAALTGTIVINNPFWWTADDKFFNYALAIKAGRGHSADGDPAASQASRGHDRPVHAQPDFPLNWEEIFDYVGFPAFLKPYSGGGWKHVYKVHSPEEFFHAYNQTGDLCMTLQHGVEFKEYFRCYVVGQENVHIMHYDPESAFSRALCEKSCTCRSQTDRAGGEGCADLVPGAGLRPQHGGVCGGGWRSLRHRLYEPGAGRGHPFRGPGEFRLGRECRRGNGCGESA